MITAVHKAPPPPAPGAAPSVLAALGAGFASLLQPSGESDAAPAGERQGDAAPGSDLPDDPVAVAAPFPLDLPVIDLAWSEPAVLPTPGPAPAGLVVAANPLAATLPVPLLAPPPTTPASAPTPSLPTAMPLGQPLTPAISVPTPGPTLTSSTTVASAPTPTAGAPAPAGVRNTIEQQQPLPVVATQQAIAVMAERPAPLVQGLIATVRIAAERPALSPAAAERERLGEPVAPGITVLPVAATPIESHRTMLDLRQEHWPQRMVDHIAALRDAADANDTRIRLVPDALGTIDVHLRRDDERVHVTFAADRAETRALLDEARPKLAELGEAKGLRFAQSGTGQGNGQQERAPTAPRLPSAPARAATTDPDPTDAIDPDRLA